VKTQVWTALIALLMLKYLQLKSRFGWSLSNLIALLRQQLFMYRDLYQWLDDPSRRHRRWQACMMRSWIWRWSGNGNLDSRPGLGFTDPT